MVGNIIRVEWYYDGVGQKSGCIEFDLVSSMERVNAVLYPCRGRTAVYFFESMAGVVSDFSSAWQLRPWPLRWRTWLFCSHGLHDRLCCKRGKVCCPFVVVALVELACHPFQVWRRGQVCCCWKSWRNWWVVVRSCLRRTRSCYCLSQSC